MLGGTVALLTARLSDDAFFSSIEHLIALILGLAVALFADLRSLFRDRRRAYVITSRRIGIVRPSGDQVVDDWEISGLSLKLHGEGERGTLRIALDENADLDRPWWKRDLGTANQNEEETRIVELADVDQPLAAKAAIERLMANARRRAASR